MIKFVVFFLLFLISISEIRTQPYFQPGFFVPGKQSAKETDELFKITEIPVFKRENFKSCTILENGYASADIKNLEAWKVGRQNRIVDEIILVFTKYPINKEDWITNYNYLLKSRLTELFKLDSSLNSTKISYRILLQTNCKSDAEARSYFHGIIIRYHLFETQLPVQRKIKSDSAKIQNDIYDMKVNDFEEFERYRLSQPLQNETLKRKKQKCPDFKKKTRKF